MPAEHAAELLTIKERHGSVRRDGQWTLPRRLALRVRLAGRMRHGRIRTRWVAPRS